MDTALRLDAVLSRSRLSALLARSEINIRHSQALVTAAEVIGRAAQRLRRPLFAGGMDDSDTPSVVGNRIVRTWNKMKAGALPTDGARRRWVGPGRGERCNGCGDSITLRETEFEIDFRNTLLLRFHAECFRIWEGFDSKER